MVDVFHQLNTALATHMPLVKNIKNNGLNIIISH